MLAIEICNMVTLPLQVVISYRYVNDGDWHLVEIGIHLEKVRRNIWLGNKMFLSEGDCISFDSHLLAIVAI